LPTYHLFLALLFKLTYLKKCPSGFSRSSSGLPNSATLPASITKILSESMTVFNRCAIVNIVHSLNLSRITPWINWSVFKSTLAVASSSTMTLALRRTALARQTNCLCPTLTLAPPSRIRVSSPPDQSDTTSFICTSSKAFHSSVVCEAVERVKVLAQRAQKQHRVLRDDRDLGSEHSEGNGFGVNVVDQNGPFEAEQAENRRNQGSFPGAGPSDYSHFLPTTDLDSHLFENWRVGGVAHRDRLERDLSAIWPRLGRDNLPVVFFGGEFRVLQDAFD
jgi:hypothetical protein